MSDLGIGLSLPARHRVEPLLQATAGQLPHELDLREEPYRTLGREPVRLVDADTIFETMKDRRLSLCLSKQPNCAWHCRAISL